MIDLILALLKKFDLKTAIALAIALAGLVAAYVTGFLGKHPDVAAIAVAVEQILSAFLGPLKASAEGKPGVSL